MNLAKLTPIEVEPGGRLRKLVEGGFEAQGLTLDDWCFKVNMNRYRVIDCLTGSERGLEAENVVYLATQASHALAIASLLESLKAGPKEEPESVYLSL